MPALLSEDSIGKFKTDADTAYAAGFFDGEGHANQRITKRPNGKQYQVIHISIGQCNKEVLEWFQSIYGGSLYEYKLKPNGRMKKTFWQWSITGTRAYVFLKQIRPFVRVKQDQIDTAIRRWENR